MDAQKMPIPGAVKTLSWVSFFADISSEMVYTAIPLFIVGVLKAPAAALGLTEGIAEAIVSFVKGWSGWHSDRRGKRLPYIRIGYGLSAISKPIIGLVGAWPLVTVGRGLDRFGKGLRGSARDAMISDATPKEIAGKAFGFHRMMDTSGALLGVLIGYAFLTAMPDKMRLLFLLAGIPGILSVAVTLALKEKPREAKVEPETPKASPAPFKPDRHFKIALAAMTFFALANSSDTFLLLKIRDDGYSIGGVALVYAAYNFLYAALSYPLGSLSDRIGRTPVLALGWFLYGLTYLGFAKFGGSAPWGLMAMYGLYMAATDGVGKALVSDVAPKASKGTAMGLFFMVTGLATLASSVCAGLLWDRVNHAAPFLFGGTMALVSLCFVPFLHNTLRRDKALA